MCLNESCSILLHCKACHGFVVPISLYVLAGSLTSNNEILKQYFTDNDWLQLSEYEKLAHMNRFKAFVEMLKLGEFLTFHFKQCILDCMWKNVLLTFKMSSQVCLLNHRHFYVKFKKSLCPKLRRNLILVCEMRTGYHPRRTKPKWLDKIFYFSTHPFIVFLLYLCSFFRILL
jgi:hypothetical protein